MKQNKKMVLHVSSGISVPVEVELYPERKMVVAKAIGCEDLALKAIPQAFHSLAIIQIEDNSRLWEKITMKPIYVAVARCHADDVFDAAFGKEWALDKLKEKLQRVISNRKCNFAKELVETAERLKKPIA